MSRSIAAIPLACLSCVAQLAQADDAQSPTAAVVASHPDWHNALRPTGAPGPELTLASQGARRYQRRLCAA
jgi:hypothetical protein